MCLRSAHCVPMHRDRYDWRMQLTLNQKNGIALSWFYLTTFYDNLSGWLFARSINRKFVWIFLVDYVWIENWLQRSRKKLYAGSEFADSNWPVIIKCTKRAIYESNSRAQLFYAISQTFSSWWMRILVLFGYKKIIIFYIPYASFLH